MEGDISTAEHKHQGKPPGKAGATTHAAAAAALAQL